MHDETGTWQTSLWDERDELYQTSSPCQPFAGRGLAGDTCSAPSHCAKTIICFIYRDCVSCRTESPGWSLVPPSGDAKLQLQDAGMGWGPQSDMALNENENLPAAPIDQAAARKLAEV